MKFLLSLVVGILTAAVAAAQTTLPDGRVGSAYSFQITTSPAASAGTVYGVTNLPAGLSVNASTGIIAGTPTAAGTAAGTLSLTEGGVTNNYSYQLAIDPQTGTPVITSATTAAGTAGTVFSYTTTASNGPITGYNITGLPSGLSANASSGAITGTPSAAGTASISISANNAVGTGAAVTVTLNVAAAAGTPAITSGATASGTLGTGYTSGSPLYQIQASNSPSSYSAVGLPLGLSVDAATGLITGTPAANGVSTVQISAANGSGSGTAKTLTLTIGALPVISSGATLSATTGSAFSSQLTATNTPTSFNVSGLPTGVTATSAGLLSGTPATAGSYTVSASANNSTGTGPTTTIAFTVSAPSIGGGGGGGGSGAVAPTIVTGPVSQTVTAGSTVTFNVTATTSSGVLTYQWLEGSVLIPGATASSLVLTNVQPANAGAYAVIVSNGVAITSNAAQLTVSSGVATPITITTQPVSQTVAQGAGVTFSVTANGTGALSYQWQFNGVTVPGATASSYAIASAQAANQGSYTVVVSSGGVSATSNAASLTVTAVVVPARLYNLSMSAVAGLGGQPLTVGFSIGGTGMKSALVRAIGPGLADFGITAPLPDPSLTLFSGAGKQLAADTVWGGTPALIAVFAQTGAFALPENSKDSALLQSLATGTYSAVVTSASNASGTVILEAYDADTATSPTAQFVNLSGLAQAGGGANVMTVGFVIGGQSPLTLLVRGVGPTLAQFGVPNPLAATKLTLFSGQTPVVSNSGWGGSAALVSAFGQVNAFALPAGSLDSALLVTLQPGSYTVQLSSATSATGAALIELYQLP